MTTNRGARVQICGDTLGEDALRVAVEGSEGNFGFPDFHVKVMPLTVVTAVVGVVELVDGTNLFVATTFDRVANDLETANKILSQSGMKIALNGGIQTITATPIDGYWNVVGLDEAFSNLCSTLSCPGGLEIYYVHSISAGASTNAGGLYTSVGMLISTGAADRTLAHEILHACGADDIYWESKNHVVQLTDMVEENSQPDDWGRYSLDDGQVMPQSNIVQRLLMHGKSTSIKGDIPTGRVYGLQKWRMGGQLAYGAGMCFVGLSAMTNTPISH